MAIPNIPDFTDDIDAAQYIEENSDELRLIFADQVLVNVNAGYRLIDRLSAKGSSNQEIIDNLVMDFNQGGSVFSGLKQQFRQTGRDFSNDAVNDAYDSAYNAELASRGIIPGEVIQMWVSVLSKGTCETCHKMHGTTHTRQEWIGRGPHEIFTECGQFCNCELVDSEIIGKDLGVDTLRDIKKEATQEKRDWTKSLKDKTTPITRTSRAMRRDHLAEKASTFYNRINDSLGAVRAETRYFKDDVKTSLNNNRRKAGL